MQSPTVVAGLLLAAAWLPAQQEPAVKSTAADRMRELQTEQKRIADEWPEKRKQLFADAEKAKASGGSVSMIPSSPDFAPLVPMARRFADEFAATPDAAQFLAWIVENALGNVEVMRPALAELLDKHRDSAALVGPCPRLVMLAGEPRFAERVFGAELSAKLREALPASGNVDVAAWGALLLHRATIEAADLQSDGYLAARKVVMAAAERATQDAVKREIHKLVGVREKYSVGCTAPDIVGEDLDGVAFKLSDYRGKVVFLDFWGDW
ncbi:MAG: AhpC/TSA family [Planctomycetota bacterium]|jgi:hypothetical protein